MNRFAPYLGIVAALLLGFFIYAFSDAGSVEYARVPEGSASSTLSVLPPISFPALTLPDILPQPSAVSSTSRATTAPPPAHETVPVPARSSSLVSSAPTASPVPAPATPSSGNADLDASAALLRSALVNILCFAPAGSALHSISGSGVIITPSGLILTNAHVAQYFLLKDKGVSCTVRTGSPAKDAYTADLAFISGAWVRANAGVITQAAPSGTGEHDYALLAISGADASSASAAAPPFPFIPIQATPASAGTPVVIGSYGAQFLESSQIQDALFPTITFGSVKDVYTFGTNTIDVLALGGSAAAQEGSSGGGIANAEGALVGTITTSTVTGDTSTRSLDAISTSYIRAAYASETGAPLDFLLTEATTTAVAHFSSDASALESLIVSAAGL